MYRPKYLLIAVTIIFALIFLVLPRADDHSAEVTSQKVSGAENEEVVVEAPADEEVSVDPSTIHIQYDLPSVSSHSHAQVEVKRELARFWIDEDGKAGRRRVRIVESGFKYPNLRLEESVQAEEGGLEKVALTHAAVADHLMVKLKPEVEMEGLAERFSELGFRLLDLPVEGLALVQFDLSLSREELKSAREELEKADDLVAYAEPDYLVFPTVAPNDPAYRGRLWSLDNVGITAGSRAGADIDAPEAWDIVNDASEVIVAVTDSGVRYTHEDLAANMWQHPESGVFGWDAYDNDSDPIDLEGHGTHVAGTIGARGDNGRGGTGVAWKVQLMALRFIGPNGGATSDAIRVIDYARENGADIINASWGGRGRSQALEDAILACAFEEIIVVAAAGNEQSNTDEIPHYPSSLPLPNIVSVASTDSTDHYSEFSNFGSTTVDLAAPGSAIWSCGSESDSAYQYRSGTSMAAPHVAGALALGKAFYRGENSQRLIERLLTSTDIVSGQGLGRRLNLFRFLSNPAVGTRHDAFNNPYVMEGCQDYWCWFNTDATREDGEDQFSPDTGERSFWFRWVAPADGLVQFDGSAWVEDISVVAFRGSLSSSLVRVADNFSERPVQESALRFYVSEGEEYRFSLDSRSQQDQIVAATLTFTPENDFFDQAEVIENESFRVEGLMCGATSEPFEQARPHAGVGKGKSLWWRWTAAQDGPFTINTSGTSFDSVLAVYTGQKENLVEVASNDDLSARDWTSEVSFNAVAGRTYYIAVDTYRSEWLGRVILSGFSTGELIIFSSPQSGEGSPGDLVDFRVVAAGDRVSYLWRKDGNLLPWPEDRSTLSLRPIRVGSFGNYSVEIRSGAVSETRSWTFTRSQIAPFVEFAPSDVVALEGGELNLNPVVSGTPPLTHQWYFEGSPIEGATDQLLSVSPLALSNAGDYFLLTTNPAGSVQTNTIRVTLTSGDALNWVQRRPGVQDLEMLDGLSHQGMLHFVTRQGYWLSGTSVAELRPQRLQGMHAPKGLGVLGNKLVIYGQEISKYDLAEMNHLMVSEDGRTWSKILSDLPEGGVISHFVSSDEVAVVMINRKLYASSDLTSWVPAQGTDGSVVHALEYASGIFVASRYATNEKPFSWVTSTDGVNWTERVGGPEGRRIPNGENLRSVNGRFYLPSYYASPDGQEANLSISSDGLSWTHVLGNFPPEESIAYFDGLYVSSSGGVSSDGIVWDPALNLGGSGSSPNEMIVHEGSLVRARSGTNGSYIVSVDSAFDFPSLPDRTIAPSSQYEVVGGYLRGRYPNAISVDGIHWGLPEFTKGVGSFVFESDGDQFWGFGESGGIPRLYRGPEPTLLSPIPASENSGSTGLYSVGLIRARGNHVLVGGSTEFWSAELWSSQNSGASWSEITTLDPYQNSWKTVATDSGFVIFRAGEAELSRDGGLTWQTKTLTVPGHRSTPVIGKAIYQNGVVSYLDQEGYLHFSDDDGETWTYLDLGEGGWISMTPHSDKWYVLHEDGRVAVCPDRTSVILDSGLVREGAGVDLVSFNGALFATVRLAEGLGFYQAGVLEEVDLNLTLEGLDEGSLYEPGSQKELRWSGKTGHQDLATVRVYLDGNLLGSFDKGDGGMSLEIPDSGAHNLTIVGETESGKSITRSVGFFSRSRAMRVVDYGSSSDGREGEVKHFTKFQGAVYAGERHGRILRTGNGLDWDLALHLPLPTEGLVSNDKMILALTEKALYRSLDGVIWESKSLGSVTDRFFEDGSPGYLRTTGGQFVLETGFGTFHSMDGFHWEPLPVDKGINAGAASFFKGLWIANDMLWDTQISKDGSRPITALADLGFPVAMWEFSDQMMIVLSGKKIRFSTDGERWEEAEGEFEDVREIREIDGHFFVNVWPVGGSESHYTSSNGRSWREVSRVPDRIHKGVWWRGQYTSLDGIDWVLQENQEAAVVLEFVGDGRIVGTNDRDPSVGFSFNRDGMPPQEIDFESLFDGRDHPEASNVVGAKLLTTEDGTTYAFRVLPGSRKSVSVRSPDGQWARPVTVSHIPNVYFKGLFYSRESQFDYWVSSDLRNWELRSLTPLSDRESSIRRIQVLGDELFISTLRNAYGSVDGTNFDSAFIAAEYDLPRLGDLIQFQGQVIVLNYNSSTPILIRQNDGLWLPPANGFPANRLVGAAAFVQNGRLHIFHGESQAVLSTSDLSRWDSVRLPVEGTFSSLQGFYNTPVQSGLIFNPRTPQVFTLDARNEWLQEPELTTLEATYIEGMLFHERANITWASIEEDLSISVDRLSYDEVALNSPIEVELTISNQQATDFVAYPDSQLRLWALPGGINDYELRVPLASVDLAGMSFASGEDQVITRTVQFPDETIPGNYRIAAELYRANDHFDDLPLNNLSKFEESLELEARELVLTSNGEGSIQRDNASLLYANGALVSLNATAGKGASFMGWDGDVIGARSQITVTMNSDKEIAANFTSTVGLQVALVGDGGVAGQSEGGLYPVGSMATLTADPAPGWIFVEWRGAATGSAPSISLTMDATQNVTAVFALPFEAWKSQKFTPGQLSNSEISGDSADFDSDGLSTWQEYLHGSDPLDGNSRGRSKETLTDQFLIVTYTRNTGAVGGKAEVRGSYDFQIWNPPGFQERILGTADGVETIEARLPRSGQSKGFLVSRYSKSP